MGLTSTTTLNGHRATSARATIPKWGCWYAEASIDGEVTLSGAVTLQIADLALKGTILSGGPQLGRSTFRIVAGAGGWGKQVKRYSYADDGSTKRAKVIADAAREVGETYTEDSSGVRVGPNYTRPAGPASRVLELEAPQAWYVDELGVTRLGVRTPGTLPAKATRLAPVDRARGKVVLAAESIATILPGVVVDGLEAVDVLHEVSAAGGLRSTVWGGARSSDLDKLRTLVEQLDPDRRFRGVSEYRVVTTEGKRLNLQAVRASSGMPDLLRVPVRPGVAGCEAELALGARVLVGFVDSDPGRPYVAAFEDADGGGFLPTSLTLLEGSAGVARTGDAITITPLQFAASGAANGSGPVTLSGNISATITGGSTKVRCG